MSLPSLESLAGRILREHEAALTNAESAIGHARAAGKLLLEARERCEGKWLTWMSENCSAIAERTAQKYMQIARQPQIEAKSIGEALLKLATPRQPNNPPGRAGPQATDKKEKDTQKSDAQTIGQRTPEKAAAVVDLPKAEQLKAATAKPEPESDGSEPDDNEEAVLELAAKEREASLAKVLGADDKLAAAAAEIKRQAAEIAALKVSRNGFMNGKASVEKLLASEQRKTARLEKRVAELEKQLGKKAA